MRIVIADDHLATLKELQARLTSWGYEVVAHARSGREAVELCRKYHPDLVVLDIMMPPVNGDEALIIIRSENLAGNALLATSQGQDVVKDLAKRLGVGIVRKPYAPGQLKAAVEEIERGASR
jgi:DNA-binding NarL/FixJ family response regulator